MVSAFHIQSLPNSQHFKDTEGTHSSLRDMRRCGTFSGDAQ